MQKIARPGLERWLAMETSRRSFLPTNVPSSSASRHQLTHCHDRQSDAPGGRQSETQVQNTQGQSTQQVQRKEGFGLSNDEDVKGSLKIHIKLDLEADIRIIAKIKGDIAIGTYLCLRSAPGVVANLCLRPGLLMLPR